MVLTKQQDTFTISTRNLTFPMKITTFWRYFDQNRYVRKKTLQRYYNKTFVLDRPLIVHRQNVIKFRFKSSKSEVFSQLKQCAM